MLFRKLFRMLVLGGAAVGANAGCSTAQAQQATEKKEDARSAMDGGTAAQFAQFAHPVPVARFPRIGPFPRLLKLRQKMHQGIISQLDEVELNGHPAERLPGNLNLSFAYVEGEGLMMGMKDVAVSSGSACTSASLEPSYVLKALGVGDDLAHSSIRFGLGRFNTEDEVDFTIDHVVTAVRKLREMSPLYEMHKEGVDLKSVQWAAH